MFLISLPVGQCNIYIVIPSIMRAKTSCLHCLFNFIDLIDSYIKQINGVTQIIINPPLSIGSRRLWNIKWKVSIHCNWIFFFSNLLLWIKSNNLSYWTNCANGENCSYWEISCFIIIFSNDALLISIDKAEELIIIESSK